MMFEEQWFGLVVVMLGLIVSAIQCWLVIIVVMLCVSLKAGDKLVHVLVNHQLSSHRWLLRWLGLVWLVY